MKRAMALLAVLLLLCAAILPDAASAGGRHGHARHGGAWWLPGAIIGGLVLGAAAVATAPLWALAAPSPSVVTPAPAAYVQTADAAPAPPAYSRHRANTPPPFNRAVVYANGRYLLFGDGVTHPWQWVWVPAAPPPTPPPRPR